MRRTCMTAVGTLLAGLTMGTVAGCSLNRQADREIRAAFEQPRPRMPGSIASYAMVPAPAATQPAVTQSAAPGTAPPRQAEVLETLRDYLVHAVEHNPDVLRAEQIARSHAARVAQATALDDPMLMTNTLPTPVRTAEGDNYFRLSVTQKLPVPAKLDARGRVALEATRAAIADWQQVRQRVIGDVKRAWFRLYVIDRNLVVLQENLEILGSLVDVVRAQVEAGLRGQAYLLRARVELDDVRARIIDLRQQRITAAATLNALLDRAPTTPVPEPPPFGLRRTNLEIDRLLEVASRVNPRLEMLRRQIDSDRQAVRLARLAYWPDFTVGAEWMLMVGRDSPTSTTAGRSGPPPLSEDGSDNVGIMLGFNIPIWHQKIEAGIREARHNLEATRMAYASAHNSTSLQVQDALARVRAQQDLVELFADAIIPQAKQAYESALASYRVGAADFEFLIENWQRWLQSRIQYYRARGELERAVADLEQAIGESLVEADQPAAPAAVGRDVLPASREGG